eukprot:87847_1
MVLFAFWFIMVLMIELHECSMCNYVYEMDTTRAYPTDLCMSLGTNSYVKYKCTESSAYQSGHTITLQSFSSDDCALETLIQQFDLNEWIAQQNNASGTDIQITYNCGGVDNCFIEYNDECNGDNTSAMYNRNRYYPVQQCLNNYNKSMSFKYECNPLVQTLSYFEYDGPDCDDSNYNVFRSILGATASTTACMKYIDCKTTNAPTRMPSGRPTFFIPFRNKSLDKVIEVLSNGTDKHNSSAKYKHSFSVFVVFLTTIILVSF